MNATAAGGMTALVAAAAQGYLEMVLYLAAAKSGANQFARWGTRSGWNLYLVLAYAYLFQYFLNMLV